MLAHRFSAFFNFIALTALLWAQCVCVLECVCETSGPPLSRFSCWATRFISTCLQKYRSMPELGLWKIVEIKSSRNFSSVCCGTLCARAWAHNCAKTYVFIAAWHVCLWLVTFPCEDVFITCICLSFFFWLSYMQICTKHERKKNNNPCWYLCITCNLAIQQYNRIVSCK